MLERHQAGLRTYLAGLQGAEAARVEIVMQEIMREAPAQMKFEEDPAVWMFAEGRRRVSSGGQRGDVLVADAADGAREDEVLAGEDPRIATHRAFARLTNKQQEVLRLKFQFGFNLEELARITGVNKTAAGGLLHFAVERICQAVGASLSLGMDQRVDVRLTAYALDEMEPADKQAFAESVPDGKALLESSDAIRKAGQQLTSVLESGAPLPQRRRRRKGGAGWKSPAVLLGGGAIVVAAALGWYFWTRSGETADAAEDTSAMHGDYAGSMRARPDETTNGSGQVGDSSSSASHTRTDRPPRPGEADWERKPFGRGNGKGPGAGAGASAGAPAAQPGGETGPASTAGGSRSRGAASGPTSNVAPAAEARGESGKTDAAEPAAPAEAAVQDEATPPLDPASAPDDSPPASSTARPAAGHELKPAKPDLGKKPAPEPGSGKAASQVAPVAPPALGVAEMRRQLAKRQWPKPAEVRLAEMVKQAPPDAAPEQAPEAPLAAQLEIAPSPWKPDKQIVRVTLKAKAARPPSRPRANLVFAIDVSRSMAGTNRLPLVQEGIRLLADRLRPEDRVAVVTYATKAVEALPANPLGEKGLELRNCLSGLEAAGLTNGYEGLQLAYAAARKSRVETGLNAVILCTDGNFNLGETDDAVLAALVAQAAAEGIKLSVFGFGRSDRNDERLELLATKGGGRSCYVNTREEAERLLATQVDGLVEAAAHEVTLDVKFNPARVADAVRIDGAAKEASSAAVGELLPGRTVAALYEVSLKPGGERAGELAELIAHYRRPGSSSPERMQAALEGGAGEWARAGAGFRFAAAWAEFGRILQGPAASADGELDRLEAWVQRVLPDDAGGYRQELLENVAMARQAEGN